MGKEPPDAPARLPIEFLFGYGSIINPKSRASTLGKNFCPGVLADVSDECPWVRSWNFRSSTGFTALGLRECRRNERALGINGIIFPLDSLSAFDVRESGYTRVHLPLHMISLHIRNTSTRASAAIASGRKEKKALDTPESKEPMESWVPILAEAIKREKAGSGCEEDGKEGKSGRARVWLYVPNKEFSRHASADYPICQSYIDTCLSGCLEEGGKQFARAFIAKTKDWCHFYLNDIPLSRRPWLHRGQHYRLVDDLLTERKSITFVHERRHPEEFAAQFLRGLGGLWGVPNRNPAFTSREAEVASLSSLLSVGKSARVYIAGMGGVGKTQLAIEHAHRHFMGERDLKSTTGQQQAATVRSNVKYSLIVWLRAETREALVDDVCCAALDLGLDVKGKSNLQVAATFQAALCQSSSPWLLIFDNAESLNTVDEFAPRGVGQCVGHVVVTSRVLLPGAPRERSMVLDCFRIQDSVRFLSAAAGKAAGVEGAGNHGRELARMLGGLPLALAMAAAYMRRSDVSCQEYVSKLKKRHNAILEHRISRLTEHKMGVGASLSLSVARLASENKSAERMLRTLSFMAPDGITKSMVTSLLREFKRAPPQPHLQSLSLLSFYCGRGHEVLFGWIGLVWVGFVALGVGVGVHVWGRMRGGGDGKASPALRPMSQTLRIHEFERYGNPGSFNLGPNHSVERSVEEDADVVWDALKTYCLIIVRQSRAASMHRLLQEILRARHSPEATRVAVERCVGALESLWRFDTDDPDTWLGSGALLEHIKAVAAHAEELGARASSRCLGSVARILIGGATFMTMAFSRFDEAHAMLTQALALAHARVHRRNPPTLPPPGEKAPKEWTELAVALRSLGQVLRYRGFYVAAEKPLLQALDIQKRGWNLPLPTSPTPKNAPTSHPNPNPTASTQPLGITTSTISSNAPKSTPSPTTPDGKQLTDRYPDLASQNGPRRRKRRSKNARGAGSTSSRGEGEYRGMEEEGDILGGVGLGVAREREGLDLHEMAVTLHELGVLYSKMARSAEAERSLGTALAIKRSLAKRDGRRGAGEIGALEGATVFRSVAASLHQLGVLAMTARPPRYKQAATRLQEALKLEGMHGGYTSSVRTAATRTQLGKIALRRGNLDEAEKQLKAALATLQKTYKSELHVNVASARHQLGLVAQLKLKWDDAAFHFQQALRIRQKVYASPCNIEVAFTLRELGRLERARGDLKAAEAYFQEHSGVIGRILENPKLTPAKITRVSKEAIACKYALRSLLREQKRTEDVKNCSEEIMDFKRRVAKAERTSEDMRKAAIISPCASQSLLAALRLRERLRTTILSCQANSIHLDLSWLKGDIDQVRTLARREDGGDHEVILAAINTIAKEMEEVKGTEDNYDIDTKALLLACDAIRGEARNRGIKVVDKVLKKKR